MLTYALVTRGFEEDPGKGNAFFFTLPLDLSKPFFWDTEACFAADYWAEQGHDDPILRTEDELVEFFDEQDAEECDFVLLAFRQDGPETISVNYGYYRPVHEDEIAPGTGSEKMRLVELSKSGSMEPLNDHDEN